MTQEALKLALDALETELSIDWTNNDEFNASAEKMYKAIAAIKKTLAQPEQEPVMILSDGSAFGVMSFPLPDDHWLCAPNEYRDGEYEPIDLPKPILTHELRDAVVAAVRYAVRGATMRGQETDFDPDALVQNAVYALCGPYTTPPQRKPLTDKQILADETLRYYFGQNGGAGPVSKQGRKVVDAIEALHDIKENT